MPHGIPTPSVVHGNGSKASPTLSARPAGIRMDRPHRRFWSSRRTQDDQRSTPTSGAAVVAQHGVLLPMPTFLTACTRETSSITCRPRWGATRAEKRANKRVGMLPMRNGSRHGAAPEDEDANPCIFKLCHTAPGDDRLPLAETVCGIMYHTLRINNKAHKSMSCRNVHPCHHTLPVPCSMIAIRCDGRAQQERRRGRHDV
jgi:hypothetical protein